MRYYLRTNSILMMPAASHETKATNEYALNKHKQRPNVLERLSGDMMTFTES